MGLQAKFPHTKAKLLEDSFGLGPKSAVQKNAGKIRVSDLGRVGPREIHSEITTHNIYQSSIAGRKVKNRCRQDVHHADKRIERTR